MVLKFQSMILKSKISEGDPQVAGTFFNESQNGN
jgi:hypothetical protein